MLMGTLGGNICNASPAADTAPALMVFDASAVLKSAKGARKVLLREFFTGPGKTVMQPGEILTAIELPKPVRGTGSAFMKISRVVADISQVCVAVVLVRDGDKITDCRIALGSVGPTPVRMKHAVSALIGQRGTAEAFAAAADIVSKDITPITDVRATEKYRRHVARIIVRDALQKAWLRAAEGAAK
ncbi:MAG: FAD binding domain-containing protein [Rhodobacter sp.]|nr:FAD binding domain-containing protein [Rhodobacter sp.]